MKRILLLGGSYGQIPAIVEANKRGHYTILCDYLPDNPGQHFADEFFLASTTDQEKILEIAKELQIDLILSYCSDPAVKTAAYVSGKMGLMGNTPESVDILTHKDRFREFQKRNHFNVPEFDVITDPQLDPKKKYQDLLPAIVKPVDSSDTKGVTLIHDLSEFQQAVKQAFQYTRCDRVIIEQKVGSKNGDFNGDGFVVNGELCFCELGDHIFSATSNPLKPCSTIFPSQIDNRKVKLVKEQVSNLIQKTGYKNGPLNIEARIDEAGDIYIMEIGPRNGGNFIPQAIYYSTGFNMLKALFDLYLGEEIIIPKKNSKSSICFTLHSNQSGIFKSFQIDDQLKSYLKEQHLFIKPGELIKPYSEVNSSIGSLLFQFDDNDQIQNLKPLFYQKIMDSIQLENSVED
ncbi:MAG: ATP-grasp domain-containing protein [Bacteroidetes bacterium]|jgi:biotin carboxylase|nr:ATP-grasp domain-containing protein [Bacteroidota bacterium]